MDGILVPLILLLVGIIVGWLLSWLFGSSAKQQMSERIASLESDLRARTAELADCNGRADHLERSCKARISELEADLQARTVELESAHQQLAELQARTGELEADLQARTAESESAGQQVADLRAHIGDLEADLRACRIDLEASRRQLADLRATEASRLVEPRAATVEALADVVTDVPADDIVLGGEEEFVVDDFTAIAGIGPAYAARLGEAGITRYADLAEVDPKELPDIVGLRSWQQIDAEDWVAQARVLADQPRPSEIGDDLTLLEGIGPAYSTRLRAAGIVTFGQLAASNETTLALIIGAPGWRRVNYGDWIAQAKLAAAGDQAGLQALQDQLFRPQGENLELIEGIGPVASATLRDAGITSYALLAAATPEQLALVFEQAGQRGGNYEAWIAEAKLRAAGKRVRRKVARSRTAPEGMTKESSCPQDLEAVKGIGRVYEQRLYAAGLGTYWELGVLPDEELASILGVKDLQQVDLAGIKVDAMRLAGATNSVGVIWDGTEPDDFEILEGIGPVLERRLYAAGICTYEALAAATEQQLERICRAPAFQDVNYKGWIAQAREQLA